MSNHQNRNRVIYFRISEEEFQQFKELCSRVGAKNMSDLVRSAIKALTTAPSDGFAARLEQLECSVQLLNQRLAQGAPESQA